MPRNNSIHPYYFSKKKRLFDVAISGIWIILALPFFVFISLSILFVGGGQPIFFLQKRTGLGTTPFTIYKFRTMYVGAEADISSLKKKNQAPEPMFKIFDDPRFVGIGRFLSASGLDELPQLLNVLRGEMSLIGPRPLPVKQAQQLGEDWNFRTEVKPGLFSEWTISTERHASAQKWIQLDKATLLQGSWKYDLGVILRTFFKRK